MATLTTNPGSLSVIKQKVLKAYFAKKVVTGSKASDEKMSYTFRGGVRKTKTQKEKEKIAGDIYKIIKPDLDKNNQTTTIEEIVKGLTKDSHKKPDKIEFALTKDTVRFDGISGDIGASLGDELYVVVETENIPAGREIKMNFRQGGDEKVVTDVGDSIFITQEGSDLANYLFKAVVGGFYEENSVANAADFENYAIVKIKLGSTNEEDNKKYREALDKAEGKKTSFYLLMDAEPEGQNWAEVTYEDVVNNRPNVWYYGEGNWFEFGNSKLYKKEDKGADCGKILQEINIRLSGFGGNLPDEDFTERTEKAVKQFQKDYMKIEPTGIVDNKTLEAIDEFSENYKETISEYECPCTNSAITERPDKDKRCSGFGKKQFKGKYKSSNKSERNYKYEYPGIHRSLLWGISAIRFYMKDTSYGVKTIFRGYRCWADNLHNPHHKNRSSTNHMGKAADLHFNKNGKATGLVSEMEYVREHFFSKYLGAPKSGAGQTHGFGWKKNHFGLEPKKFNKNKKGIEPPGATSWVHVDVREFDKKYLKEELFISKQNLVIGKKLSEY